MLPSKSPVAGLRSDNCVAPNVIHLKGCLLRSIVAVNKKIQICYLTNSNLIFKTGKISIILSEIPLECLPDCSSFSVSLIVYTFNIPCPLVWVPATTNLVEHGTQRQSNSVRSEDFSVIV